MTGKRQRYGAEFKAKVALEAIGGELTTSKLATRHGVHQTVINDWKRMTIVALTSIFEWRGGWKRKLIGKAGGEIARQDRSTADEAGFFAKTSGR